MHEKGVKKAPEAYIFWLKEHFKMAYLAISHLIW